MQIGGTSARLLGPGADHMALGLWEALTRLLQLVNLNLSISATPFD